jgi:hypothetical protein
VAQQVAVDLFQARQVQQHQFAAFFRQRVDDLAGQRGRQEGQEHGLHLHVLGGDVVRQPLRRGVLQARHHRADRVAVDRVQHGIRDLAAQRQVERALQVVARGAMQAALLAVVVEELLERGLHGVDLDAAHPAHHLGQLDQLFAFETAQHGGRRLLADRQQHDRGLFDRAQDDFLHLVIVQIRHFSSAPIV